LRDPYGDPTTELQLDGIGGVSILAKASVFRNGAHFPAFSFMKHAETEGLGKLARAMGLEVVGLPHYVIWHIYEPSDDDLKHMEWMRQEEIRLANWKKMMANYNVAFRHAFQKIDDSWNDEKHRMLKNSDPIKLSRKVEVDWSE
jgi:mannan polymerase II complex ANP1 subunit